MSMEEKIKEAIANDLPNQVGQELQKRLVKAEQDAADLKSCKKLNTDYLQATKDRDEKIKELEAKLNKQETTDKKLKEIKEAEQQMAVTLAELKKSAAERERDTVIKLVEKVFGHPSVTIERFGSKDVAVPNDHYNTPTSYNHTETTTETKQ